MIDFLGFYEKILEILPTHNIQKLTDVCYQCTGIPVLITNITYTSLGLSPKTKTGDYFWDYLIEHPKYTTDMIVRLYEEGIMQTAVENKKPYVIDWGAATTYLPKIMGVIWVDDTIEGYIAMQCTRDEINEERMYAMEIMQKACIAVWKNINSESSTELIQKKAFIGELLKDCIHSQEQLEIWRKRTNLNIKGAYQIFAVRTPFIKEKQLLSNIQKQLQPVTPYQLSLIQHNVLYILIYNIKDSDSQNYIRKILHKLLGKMDAYCGISSLFYHLTEVTPYRIQAESALDIGISMRQTHRIFDYNDYYLPAILAPRMNEMSPCNYLSPAISVLKEYDETHQSDFFNTLKCYITNLCNTRDTTCALHIHRNSLLYRLNKIEELTGLSFDDYDARLHLMLSFYMLELQETLKII